MSIEVKCINKSDRYDPDRDFNLRIHLTTRILQRRMTPAQVGAGWALSRQMRKEGVLAGI